MSGKQTPEHFDVLIVGAGISGIDAAYHLQQKCPDKSFALLESKESYGGTWLTHKYPGIRSDSDLHTFGYKWKPWVGNPIATAVEILKYLDEALDENDLRQHIRYQQKVLRASWSSEDKRWALEIAIGEGGEVVQLTCNFLWMCQGYYRHSEGYTPDFPGMEDFEGQIIHPQTWPDNLDYKDKRVVVIGSGATAATLIPSIAEECAHVTMLQRSPTYFFAAPNRYDVVNMLRELDIPEEWIHEIARQKKLLEQQVVTRRSFEEPEVLKAELIAGIRHYLGDDFDVEKHFTPEYRPWRQRLALVPDGDLFESINAGKASVVTDQIETFTPGGIRIKSGEELAADIIVTATGFNLSVMGDIEFVIDGKELDFSETCGHRGILFSGVPNLAWIFGYFRTSWTMRADLVADMVCRLLNHMTDKGVDVVTPQLRAEERDMEMRPLVDPENFNAGYLTRNIDLWPRQGDRAPWLFTQDYYSEKDDIPATDLEDGTLIYR